MEEKEIQTNSRSIEHTDSTVVGGDVSNTEQIPNIEIPSVRTYKSDINHTVHKDKISTAKILVAEQNKRRNEVQQSVDTSIKRPTNIIILILGILLIAGAIGAIGYFGYKKIVQPISPPTVAPTTFLFVFDKQEYIDTSKTIQDIQQKIISLGGDITKENQYTDLIFYKTNSQTQEKTRITTVEFLSLFDISVPTNIVRSFGREFVYGMYQTDNNNELFLVVNISNYEVLYSNMLNWESTIALDLQDLFPNLKKIFTNTKSNTQELIMSASSTATSTGFVSTTTQSNTQIPNSSDVANREIRFIDTVFSNNDVRVVRNDAGDPIFYYGFLDKTKILFAQNPKIIGQIKQKMKEKSLVR